MRWERNDKCAILISLWKSVFIKQSQRISPPLWPTCKCPILFAPITITAPVLAQWAKMRKKFYPLNLFLHWNKFPLILTIEENSALCIVLSKYLPPHFSSFCSNINPPLLLYYFEQGMKKNVVLFSWDQFHEIFTKKLIIPFRFFLYAVSTPFFTYIY